MFLLPYDYVLTLVSRLRWVYWEKVKTGGFMNKLKHGLATRLVGDTDSLTVLGPAAVIKEMKKDPSKLEIMMSIGFSTNC